MRRPILLLILLQMVGSTQFLYQSPIDVKPIKIEETYHKHTIGPCPILVLRIWLPDDEPSKANLLRIGELLKQKYKKEPRIEANIFSSEAGAKGFSELYVFAGYGEYYSTWRAMYWLDRKNGKEWLDYCEGPHDKEKNPFVRLDLKARAAND